MNNPFAVFKKENKALLSTYNAGLLQGKAYRVLNDKLSLTLKPFNLSVTEWKILGQLYDHQSLQLNEIARILDVEPPLITKLIDAMEHKKLVIKNSEESDKRVKMASISDQGKKLIPIIEKKVKICLKELLEGVNIVELITYAKVLKNIASHT